MTTSLASTTIYDVLEELRSAARTEREKGDLFERLMVSFLRTDPVWATRFSDVVTWAEWVKHNGRADTGIDLVATERETGELCAIQCKFYDPEHRLEKSDIDSFFTESGKAGFSSRLIISTTDKWSTNAEEALEGQQIPVTRLRVQDLDSSSIDWSQFSLARPSDMVRRERKQVRLHQRQALDRVAAGFASADRGKLIMACGTGKTFTSLKVVEEQVPLGGTVLFLVPSISLLSQTLNEWSSESETPLRPFAVCSDVKVGRRTQEEDQGPYDLAYPASTSAAKLVERFEGDAQGKEKSVNVVFSTYQSLQVIHEAQKAGLPAFDLVICDEAHRTTGVTLADENESSFVRVHDADYIKADKRLYMTATPRIYDDASKSKAKEGDAELTSMDDESKFGTEFHRLGFGEAVERDLLSDYKVLVLAVDEGAVAQSFQQQLAQNGELGLEDAAKIVGCWNGLSKRGVDSERLHVETQPMRRAVAFAKDIKTSKKIAALFGEVTYKLASEESNGNALQCEAQHVDGTFNVLLRNEKLDWLKAEAPDGNVCRVLSNAKCLSEGVDVPALDAVMFLNPRNSVVDVVQSVGRVMRKAPGKQYGYVILPIGIPEGVSPEDALKDNQRYKVVWQVLQALRAHDDRFNAMINKIELNKARDDKLQVIGVAGHDPDVDGRGDGPSFEQQAWSFAHLDEWKESIYARIVQKVGQRTYWEDWAKTVAEIAERHTTRIRALLDDPSTGVDESFARFLEGLRGNLNDAITRDDAIDMLAQHLITKPVFDALFEGYSFAAHNPVSLVMQAMLDELEAHQLESETESLDKFYESVRMRAAGIDNAAGKQRIVTELYEKFFKIAFPRTAESLGIVYTPVEVVDFIIRSVEHLLKSEFGASISDHGVHVLDPFTGTGTFIVRLLESGLIRRDDLLHKYTNELHANEILLLAYYIAAINIEATFHGVASDGDPTSDYVPFNGIVLTDTFQMTEADDSMDDKIFPVNNERAEHQKQLDIRVVIGNPPYSSGQTSQNDANQNLKYPTLDRAIERTYAAKSSATNKNSLYDSYIRAIRWASDRVRDTGIVAFVTNGGYIDSNTADGLRKTLVDEFASIHIYNLRGNQRTAGELSRREGGKIFGSGSRNTVAVMLLVKKPDSTHAELRYRDIGDYLTREQKLQIVADSDVATMDWDTITPNEAGDWLNQRDERFESWLPIGEKTGGRGVFPVYSGGLKTNRDSWVYNFSRHTLETSVKSMIDFYDAQVDAFEREAKGRPDLAPKELVDAVIDLDPTRFSWNRVDRTNLMRGTRYQYRREAVRVGMYRPFCKQHVYFDRQLNDMVYRLDEVFPPERDNVGIYLTAAGSHHEFTPLMVNMLPNLHLLDTGQIFPRYTYEARSDAIGLFDEDGDATFARRDNIGEDALRRFRGAFGTAVTGDDIFYFLYGLLHAPSYRHAYEADLNRMLPRIPMPKSSEQFHEFAGAGRKLSDMHLNYEGAVPFSLDIIDTSAAALSDEDRYRVSKMKFGKSGKDVDRGTIVYNDHITVRGIPDQAHRYMLGPRSGIEWIMDRYQVRVDNASGIINDPNEWSKEHKQPRYILDLLARVVTVSTETMKIVDALPELQVAD